MIRGQDQIKFVQDWDVPRPTPLSTLIEANLEFKSCQDKLKNQINESDSVRQEINEKWKELNDKKQMLKTLHLEFDKLESEDKKNRAKKKLEDEKKLQGKLLEQLQSVRQEVQELGAVKSKMEAYLNQYRIFEEYLQYVVHHNSEFNTVNDILERYRVLRNMQTQLEKTVEEDLQFMIQSRNDIDDLTEEKCNDINGLVNRLAKVRVKAKAASDNLLYWDTLVTTIKTFTAEKSLEIQMVRDATWSLYLQMCRKHKVEDPVAKNNFEKHISFIYKTIQQYKHIVQIALKKSKSPFQSHCPNTSAVSVKKPNL
ncbi:coiled-coil domain-containing protein 42 homolog [Macrosteles quadrilineatus]|uniref:coiled-coil domain-containing protein 42 homolog n=1 Tax=Macrosteles quadrilineatus TaxID=74068 RepID=UPI0023E2BD46|nr:coiled-coil domain-containing protein 42 homolog [Macrosteles quadrilineatus]